MRWWRKLFVHIRDNIRRNENIETPYRFVERVLTLSLPTALTLLLFVGLDEISPDSALIGYGVVVVLTIVLTLPFFVSLQSVSDYVSDLADERDVSTPDLREKDGESARIVEAINQMRSIWVSRSEMLKAQTLSDAAVLDSLPDPLLMLNEKGNLIGANLAARRMFGREIRGKAFEDVFTDENIKTAAKAVVHDRKYKEQTEFSVGGRAFNVKIERLPAEANAGAVAVVSFYDMTARKQFEQMQADFVANASHELRTPLSIMSGFIETLQNTAKDDEAARERFLSIMQTQAGRMASLIESLLSLSRRQMNESVKPSDSVSVPDIVANAKKMLDGKAEKTKSKIVLKLCEQEKSILGNADELMQVFQNLIDNALKYGQPQSTVTVSSKVENDRYVVSVHNTGDPIPSAALPHLFERFYRVAEKKKIQGTGLGLAIVAQIVKHHGGEIRVESSVENGTSFTVSLACETSGEAGTAETNPAD